MYKNSSTYQNHPIKANLFALNSTIGWRSECFGSEIKAEPVAKWDGVGQKEREMREKHFT